MVRWWGLVHAGGCTVKVPVHPGPFKGHIQTRLGPTINVEVLVIWAHRPERKTQENPQSLCPTFVDSIPHLELIFGISLQLFAPEQLFFSEPRTRVEISSFQFTRRRKSVSVLGSTFRYRQKTLGVKKALMFWDRPFVIAGRRILSDRLVRGRIRSYRVQYQLLVDQTIYKCSAQCADRYITVNTCFNLFLSTWLYDWPRSSILFPSIFELVLRLRALERHL
jgi:hypothetical protein